MHFGTSEFKNKNTAGPKLGMYRSLDFIPGDEQKSRDVEPDSEVIKKISSEGEEEQLPSDSLRKES